MIRMSFIYSSHFLPHRSPPALLQRTLHPFTFIIAEQLLALHPDGVIHYPCVCQNFLHLRPDIVMSLLIFFLHSRYNFSAPCVFSILTTIPFSLIIFVANLLCYPISVAIFLCFGHQLFHNLCLQKHKLVLLTIL